MSDSDLIGGCASPGMRSCSDIGMDSPGDPHQPPPLSRSEINVLVYDYLKTEGFADAAQLFKSEADVPDFNEEPAEAVSSRLEVRESMKTGNVRRAIETVNDRYPELLDGNAYLHFHMLQQELIELIRNGDLPGALRFAQDQIAHKGEKDVRILAEMEQTMALLAFADPSNSPFSSLMNVSHRCKVSREVNGAILEAEHRYACPKLELLLKLIIWSEEQLEKRGIDCPKLETILGDNVYKYIESIES